MLPELSGKAVDEVKNGAALPGWYPHAGWRPFPSPSCPIPARSRSNSGTSILKAAHGAGVDITATCGGRGRCTSCRVKFVAGTAPPPTVMDELQLGDDLVREGYRLSCQCPVTAAITVQVAPPARRAELPDPGRRGRRRGPAA